MAQTANAVFSCLHELFGADIPKGGSPGGSGGGIADLDGLGPLRLRSGSGSLIKEEQLDLDGQDVNLDQFPFEYGLLSSDQLRRREQLAQSARKRRRKKKEEYSHLEVRRQAVHKQRPVMQHANSTASAVATVANRVTGAAAPPSLRPTATARVRVHSLLILVLYPSFLQNGWLRRKR
jgi:hypothetical protein